MPQSVPQLCQHEHCQLLPGCQRMSWVLQGKEPHSSREIFDSLLLHDISSPFRMQREPQTLQQQQATLGLNS